LGEPVKNRFSLTCNHSFGSMRSSQQAAHLYVEIMASV
jgi:hypothetical protein